MSVYPQLVNIPSILDFEASSLSETSFPVSAGLFHQGKLRHWLIKPKKDWVDWSLQAQSMHGLRKSFLDENGCDADAVFREIVDLVGVSDLYSDNPYWENFWLSVLGKHSIEFKNIFGLAPSLTMDELFLMRDDVLVDSRLTPHRADHDALAWALTIKTVRDISGPT